MDKKKVFLIFGVFIVCVVIGMIVLLACKTKAHPSTPEPEEKPPILEEHGPEHGPNYVPDEPFNYPSAG